MFKQRRNGSSPKCVRSYAICTECACEHEFFEGMNEKSKTYVYANCDCPNCGRITRHITMGRDLEMSKIRLQYIEDEDKTPIQLHATYLINRRNEHRRTR